MGLACMPGLAGAQGRHAVAAAVCHAAPGRQARPHWAACRSTSTAGAAYGAALFDLRRASREVHYGNFFAKGARSAVTACHNGVVVVVGAKLDSYTLGMRATLAALEPSCHKFDHPAAGSPRADALV